MVWPLPVTAGYRRRLGWEMFYQHLALCIVCLVVSIGISGAAAADPAAIFNGKAITVYVSHPPGGGYDLYGRTLARHLGRNLPGHPTVVASKMPGAQGAQMNVELSPLSRDAL